MQEEKHQNHRLFHHNKGEVKAPVEAVVYSETAYGIDGAGKRYETTETVGFATAQPNYDKDRKARPLGTVGAGTFALYEKQQAKKDEVHKQRHKIEEEMETAAAVGGGGYTFHEHHEKKEQEKADGTNRLHY